MTAQPRIDPDAAAPAEGFPAGHGIVEVTGAITAAIEGAIEGKREQVELAIIVLLAGGHLLIEDVPGLGKTMLAKALARSIDCTVQRIQFTPDLLPSDITGVSVYNQDTHTFEFKPGAVFANIVVGDEINRASPKAQSALLEAMEEAQVSVDGLTHHLAAPFMVVATQNPVEMEGTYPLPEAQRDRFMARLTMGYPTHLAEVAMLESHGRSSALGTIHPVATAATIVELIGEVSRIHIAAGLKDYIVNLVEATRRSPELRLGASPRASLHLLKASRARAGMRGRDYVIPDDVLALVEPVLAHRVLPTSQARIAGRSNEEIIAGAVRTVPLPGRR